MEKRSLKVALLTATLSLVACLAFANEKCKECHTDIVATHAASLHGKAGKSCEVCHGGVDAHLASGSKKDIVTFGKGNVQKQNAQCLGCHSKNQNLMFWKSSKHKKEDVACVSCHSIHKESSPVVNQQEKCFACHKDVKSQANKFSHHPIIEGKIKCSDCHNPHGTLSKKMIAAETVNQLCYKCHGEKRGPYVWEHPPVAEDCVSCHVPHGSKTSKLLVDKAPRLCAKCHTAAHSVNSPLDNSLSFAGNPSGYVTANTKRRAIDRGCSNCHVTIHGSNGQGRQGKYFAR